MPRWVQRRRERRELVREIRKTESERLLARQRYQSDLHSIDADPLLDDDAKEAMKAIAKERFERDYERITRR